jgi:hypothetical protein
MSGRRASFPPAEIAAPRPLGALRFEIPVEGGKHVVVTLNDASRPQLMRALGSALLPRLTYLSLDPYKNSRPRDAYSGAVAARI